MSEPSATVNRASVPFHAPRKGSKRVVLHADDFGMNEAVNQGIITSFAEGLLTSTSILANAPAASEACAAWTRLDLERSSGRLPSLSFRRGLYDSGSAFDLGVHLNLTQGRPLTGEQYPAQLLDREGRFPGVFSLLARLAVGGSKYRQSVRRELVSQIESVRARGLLMTHLNGHQYVEMLPVVSEIFPELLKQFSIPIVRVARERGLAATTLWHSFRPAQWGLAQVKRAFAASFRRRMNRAAAKHPRDYFGTAHAGTIDLKVMEQFLAMARSGVTEIGMHPGIEYAGGAVSVGEGWDDPLSTLRTNELRLLCSTELVERLARETIGLGRLTDLTAAHSVRRAA